MKSNPAGTPVSGELVKALVAFHGHLGPFLVLGAKAGLLANALLGKDYFKTKAIVMTNPSPPYSCFVDGVQFTTGCTMGKDNIKLRKGKDVSVLFSKEDKKLRLELKKEILRSIESISSEEAAKDASLSLLSRSAYELFEVER
ncbi:formylmethanofuran dehydrogenase subunit E family protein [Candidatus Bathyarchaeota archaeon]|nr:formylmethanofuran dehydrogenase subunit E family protein [Candidatus Bathyarchaeota archaeon]